MKIICAGAWKTGTKSLAEALRILGYRVYDYDEQIMVFSDLWLRLIDGTVTDEEIRKTFENIDVLIDGPIIPYFYEVFKQFPEAKVIFSPLQFIYFYVVIKYGKCTNHRINV